MKFHIGDIVTRPFDVYNHDYERRRSVRIKGTEEARSSPNVLVGTVIQIHRDISCMQGFEGQEHKHEISYDVIWRNWVGILPGQLDPDEPEPYFGHIQRGFLEHGLFKLPTRMRTIPEIVYVAKNLATQMREKQLSDNPNIRNQVIYLPLQINALGWVVGKEPNYFLPVERGGRLDRIGQQLQD